MDNLSTKVGLFDIGAKVLFGAKYKGNRLLSAKDSLSSKYKVTEGTEVICDRAFINCRHLKSVELPNSVKAIGEEAFEGCTHLSSVNIPEGVSELKDRTFSSCNSLKCLELPTTLKVIGENALPPNLTTLSCNSPTVEISGATLKSCPKLDMVMVPKGSDEFYYNLLQRHGINAEVEEMV